MNIKKVNYKNNTLKASSFQYMKGVYELKDTFKRHDTINSPHPQPSLFQSASTVAATTTKPLTTSGIPPSQQVRRFGKVFDVGDDELRLVEDSNEIISFQSLKKKIHQSQF